MKLDPKLTRTSTIGLELAGAIGGLALLGYWADERWGTGPWLTIGGVFVGSVAGFASIVRLLKRLERDARGPKSR